MAKGKFIADAYKDFDNLKTYKIKEAVEILLKNKRSKFDETIEVSMNLGIDPRQADQMVRGSVSLPNGIGKKVRVAVFAKDKDADDALSEGADIVGTEDLAKKIQEGDLNYDRIIASPEMMGIVGKVAKILGPKGLMPNPKMGTVSPNVGEAVKLAKSGQIHFKAEKNGIVQAGIGKASFGNEKICQNLEAFIDNIKKIKPSGSKGTFINKLSISSTMGVSISCELS